VYFYTSLYCSEQMGRGQDRRSSVGEGNGECSSPARETGQPRAVMETESPELCAPNAPRTSASRATCRRLKAPAAGWNPIIASLNGTQGRPWAGTVRAIERPVRGDKAQPLRRAYRCRAQRRRTGGRAAGDRVARFCTATRLPVAVSSAPATRTLAISRRLPPGRCSRTGAVSDRFFQPEHRHRSP